jgi:hypothetical protein
VWARSRPHKGIAQLSVAEPGTRLATLLIAPVGDQGLDVDRRIAGGSDYD